MDIARTPTPFDDTPTIPTASLLKQIIDNDTWDNNAVIVFHNGKYFGLPGTSASPTSISAVSLASLREHQQGQQAHAALTKEIKGLFETSSDSSNDDTINIRLEKPLSQFLSTHLNHLTKSALISFLEDQGYKMSRSNSPSSSSSSKELPLAATYQLFSPQQQQTLDQGLTLEIHHQTTDPELLKLTTGRLRGLMPTFTAYQITDASPDDVAFHLLSPTYASTTIPHCSEVTKGKLTYPDDQTVLSEGNYQFKAIIPGTTKELSEIISLKAIQRSHEDKSEEVSFENTKESENVNKIKGTLKAVPHAGKTLVSLELFIDLKGILLPRALPDKAVRVATKLILRNIIEQAEQENH